MSGDRNSARRPLKVFTNRVVSSRNSEGPSPVPYAVLGEEAGYSVGVIPFIAVAAVLGFQLFDLFDVLEPSKSIFDVSHGVTPFVRTS